MAALPLIQRCLFCSWIFEGTALEGRTEALTHRQKAHPEIKIARKRPPSHLKSFRQAKLTTQDMTDILAARDKRARLLGITVDS